MKYIVVIMIVVFTGCSKTIDLEQEKSKIQAQINLVREAHLEKDAQLFYQPNADQWLDIRNGEMNYVNKVDRIPLTQSYLDRMEFLQLTTLGKPIIEISDDATLASYSSSVIVKGILGDQPVIWVVAWHNVLKKIDGEWKIINSTNTEASNSVAAEVILNEMRSYLGDVPSVRTISALADCTNPEGKTFKTLIYSKEDQGRMEQLSGNRHTVFKHGVQSWGKNLNSENFYENLNPNLQVFAKSHELHWISMHPDQRYSKAQFNEIVDFKERKAIKIVFKDDAENPVNFYCDFETYQPIAFEIVIDEKGNTVTTYFENWKEEDGLKLFKEATFDESGSLFKYSFSEIKLNSLQDQDFESKEARISL